MNRIAGVVVLLAGIFLAVWGLNASNSLGSEISRLFSGFPTNKAIYLVVGGAFLAIVGASLLRSRGRRGP